MRHVKKKIFLATSKAFESSLLHGSNKWTVHNDSEKCSKESISYISYTTTLTLHTCNPENEFACDNAFCVKMEKRCDGREDCENGSDEQDCGKLIIKPGYKKSLTPVPEGEEKTLVNVSLNIRDILKINELTEVFTVQMSLKREWFDRRLTYKHLKQDSDMNYLTLEESEAIWYPRVDFNNVEDENKWQKTAIENIHKVIPANDFTYRPKNNMHLFNGSENALSLTKDWSVEWICHYTLAWYPFDTQVCTMEFSSSRHFTKLQPSHLEHNHNITLRRYTLDRIEMCTSDGQVQTMVVKVTLSRPIISNILTVFIPTITLLAISFIARFFARDFIDMVIQVNLTILVILATL